MYIQRDKKNTFYMFMQNRITACLPNMNNPIQEKKDRI